MIWVDILNENGVPRDEYLFIVNIIKDVTFDTRLKA